MSKMWYPVPDPKKSFLITGSDLLKKFQTRPDPHIQHFIGDNAWLHVGEKLAQTQTVNRLDSSLVKAPNS
jgi:hypothetical protein